MRRGEPQVNSRLGWLFSDLKFWLHPGNPTTSDNLSPVTLVLLQPTSPLRNTKHIIEAMKKFESRYDNFNFLVSMKEAEHAKVLVNPIDEDDSLKFFDTDFSNYRRQGYKDFSPNGAIFIGKPKPYLKQKHFFGKKSLAFFMTSDESIDVDSEKDLLLAKIIMSLNA